MTDHPTGSGHRSQVRGVRHRWGHRGDEGTAVVEFALVVPIFALMLFAIVQFGMLFTGWSGLRNVVQTSARAAAIGDVGSDTTCAQGAGAPNLSTQEMICSTVDRIGDPVGTTVDAADPAEVGILVEDDFVTVCAQVEAQPFTSFFPSMHLASSSDFYIEDAGGPSATGQDPLQLPVTIRDSGQSENNTLDYTLNGAAETLVIVNGNGNGNGSYTYTDYGSLLNAIQQGTPDLTASWSSTHQLVLTAAPGSVLAITGGNAASTLGFNTQAGPVSDDTIESYNPYNLPDCAA